MKNNNTVSQISLVAGISLLSVAIFVLVDLYGSMKKRQDIIADLAVVNDVRYGLFNVEKWKLIVAGVVAKKIDEFEITSNMHEKMRAPVESVLHKLIVPFESLYGFDKPSLIVATTSLLSSIVTVSVVRYTGGYTFCDAIFTNC